MRLSVSRPFAILALVAGLAAAWGFGVEPGLLQERRLELRNPQWQRPPLTIAVASDLHVGAPHAGIAMLERVVAGIAAAQPDLVLLPGDFVIQGIVGGTPVDIEDIARVLGRLKAPLGVYATLGNHDWWLDGPRVRKALENAGIAVLDNTAVPLPLPGQALWLAGIGDDMTDHADARKTFATIPAGAQSLVMMHDPANAPDLPGHALVAFAGHTHGGQVRLPLFGALIVPGRAPRTHAYGWIPDVPAPTWVTSGVGTSILPVRFNCPPEYVLLRLSG